MNMEAVKLLLIVGGGILFIDGVASWMKFYDQLALYQLVRLERMVFAFLLIIVGVSL